MTETPTEVMIRYLFGELPEQELIALEDQYFSNPELFDELSRVEEDLIDDYVRDRLPSSQREKFEQVYLGNEQRKSRVKIAQALVTHVDQTNAIQPTADASFFSRLFLPIRINTLTAGLSFAALVLLLAGCAWLFVQYRQLRQQLGQARSTQSASSEREKDLQQQLADERNKANQLAEELSKRTNPQPNQNTLPTSFVSLIIAVSGTREGITGGPASLNVPSSANEVRLQVRLADNSYSRYVVKVQTADGRDFFVQRNLTPRAKALNVIVPASKFRSGDYIVVTQGVTTSGEVEDLGTTFVRVTRH